MSTHTRRRFPLLKAEHLYSPSNRPGQIERKIRNYLAAGTRLVWVVDPRRRTAVVHAPNAIPRTLTDADEIDGADALPGSRAPVRAFFERVP